MSSLKIRLADSWFQSPQLSRRIKTCPFHRQWKSFDGGAGARVPLDTQLFLSFKTFFSFILLVISFISCSFSWLVALSSKLTTARPPPPSSSPFTLLFWFFFLTIAAAVVGAVHVTFLFFSLSKILGIHESLDYARSTLSQFHNWTAI